MATFIGVRIPVVAAQRERIELKIKVQKRKNKKVFYKLECFWSFIKVKVMELFGNRIQDPWFTTNSITFSVTRFLKALCDIFSNTSSPNTWTNFGILQSTILLNTTYSCYFWGYFCKNLASFLFQHLFTLTQGKPHVFVPKYQLGNRVNDFSDRGRFLYGVLSGQKIQPMKRAFTPRRRHIEAFSWKMYHIAKEFEFARQCSWETLH